VTTGGAFHRQGLFVGSGGHYSPSPATASPLSLRETTAERRSHVALSLGRSFTSPPAGSDEGRHTSNPFDEEVPGVLRQKPRHLGPRSLSPPLFLERCVRAYSRPEFCLSTSATNTTYGHQPEPSFPRRDGGHDLLPFLTRHAAFSEEKR
jgi:hypothetical protein